MESNPKIARLYAGVPEESLSRLRAFRERFPYQSVSLSGIEWNYIDSGTGKPPLFILAGGTSIAEVSFCPVLVSNRFTLLLLKHDYSRAPLLQ